MLADRDDEERLSEAARVSQETNQMTPLIKEELRLSIMKKRHDSGQEQIKVEFSEPKEYELTSYEKMKRERRREQNRRAAQRCRQKKKLQQCGKHEVFSTIISQNATLQAMVKKLRKEKNSLGASLKEHLMSGCCRQVKLDANGLHLLQPVVAPNPAVPSVHPRYSNQLQDAQALPMTTACQADGALPSFADTFLESVSPTEVDEGVFQYYPDMGTDRLSTRTWSGTSDDVTPSDNLPEIIFDAMDATDDVFYDNDQLTTKMESGTIHQALQDASILNHAEDVWAHQDLISVLCQDPNFDPELPNEP